MKVTRKQYEDGLIRAFAVSNSESYWKWFESLSIVDRRYTLTDNRAALLAVFGRKHDWCWRGEYFFRVWVVEFKSKTFLVFTGKGTGTSVELVYQGLLDYNWSPLIIPQFMKYLHKKLKAYYATVRAN